MDGLKTGYTHCAGGLLPVGTTAKCGHRLISVVLGCRGTGTAQRAGVRPVSTTINLDPPRSAGTLRGASRTAGTTAPAGVDTREAGREQRRRYITVKEKVRNNLTVRRGEPSTASPIVMVLSMSQLRSWNKGRIKSSRVLARTTPERVHHRLAQGLDDQAGERRRKTITRP